MSVAMVTGTRSPVELELGDRASLDGALSGSGSIEDVRAGLAALARDAGRERLARYLGGAFTIPGGNQCADSVAAAYVEDRLSTVRALRALRESFTAAG